MTLGSGTKVKDFAEIGSYHHSAIIHVHYNEEKSFQFEIKKVNFFRYNITTDGKKVVGIIKYNNNMGAYFAFIDEIDEYILPYILPNENFSIGERIFEKIEISQKDKGISFKMPTLTMKSIEILTS